ncbi:ABC transporter ATP-binding protein [Tabrizicola sp. KVB23]|uniref:ABC transporter ATP-binding protein n=2 Tax=Fuscibacter oryzae TaxID=2803939 RepID=A0A8J7MZG0_9RHOB|nr:ABC transporter ATP-binding protein [Fuscibacter oryzae]
MVGVAAATAASAWIMQAFFDAISSPGNRQKIMLVAGAVALTFLVRGAMTYLQQVMLAKAGNRIVAQIQTRVFGKLLRQDAAFFSATDSSDILMRVTQGAAASRALIDAVVLGLVRDLLTFVGLLAVMFWQHALLSVLFLIVGPIAALGLRVILARVRNVAGKELTSVSEIYKILQETAAGVRIIKTFHLEGLMADRMTTAVREVERRQNAMVRLQSITVPMLDVLAGLCIAGILLISTTSLAGGTTTSPGQLMSFVTALLMAYDPARRLSQTRVQVEAALVSVQLVFDIMDRQEVLTEAPDARPLPPPPHEVRFDDVVFEYQGGKRALDHVNLTCKAGQTIAFVGPSGGGKSTLLNMILRLQDPTSGAVTINGMDLRAATTASLRAAVSYVGQETFLFSNSVRENIRLGRREATDAEVEEAARVAQAHDFIAALDQGYDTPIGENGAFLSGGQRQRIAIARAVLKNASILILDEATSALDNLSERGVRDGLRALTQGRTTIMVAHRLSTVIHADRICYLEEGRVVEEGNLEELLAMGGRFRALFESSALTE